MPGHHLLHVRDGLFEQRVRGRQHDHRHVAVDQRDGAVLEFARRITLGVDVADFLKLQRPFKRDRIKPAAPQEQHVLRLGQPRGDTSAIVARRHRLADEARHRQQIRDMRGKARVVQTAAIMRRLQRQHRQHRKLAGKGLCGRHAHLDPREDRQRDVGFPRDGRGADVHDPHGPGHLVAAIVQRGQRVGGLARLADEHRPALRRQRRLAIAELGRDIDLARQSGQPLEPVFRDARGKEGRAAAHQRQPVHLREVERFRQDDPPVLDVVAKRIAKDDGLLRDFLGHEVAVPGLVDRGRSHVDPRDGPVRQPPLGVIDFCPRAGQDDVIAVLEIRDAIGERRQRDRVRAKEHLARPVPHRQRRALAGADHQVALPLEQEGQRERAVQPRQRGAHRLDRGEPLADQVAGQLRNGFGVGLGFRDDAVAGEFGPKLAEVFDDAVMDHRDGTVAVGVGVRLRRRAVGRPAGVADAGAPFQRVVHQRVRQVDKLADLAPAVQRAVVVDGGDARAVIAAVFQPPQRLDQLRASLVAAQNAHDPAHLSRSPAPIPPPRSPLPRAAPASSGWRAPA